MNIYGFLKYPAAFIANFSFILCGFYTLNYHFSDNSTRLKYEAPVIRKFSQERLRNKRVGRRVYCSEKYKVYFIEIELPDGKTKKIEKSLGEYMKIKKGRKISIYEEKGLWGIKVIKDIGK